MKKIVLIIAMGLTFLACEDFMDTANFTKQDDNSFPLTVEEANQLIVGGIMHGCRIQRLQRSIQ